MQDEPPLPSYHTLHKFLFTDKHCLPKKVSFFFFLQIMSTRKKRKTRANKVTQQNNPHTRGQHQQTQTHNQRQQTQTHSQHQQIQTYHPRPKKKIKNGTSTSSSSSSSSSNSLSNEIGTRTLLVDWMQSLTFRSFTYCVKHPHNFEGRHFQNIWNADPHLVWLSDAKPYWTFCSQLNEQDYANVVSLVSQIVAEMYSNEEILAMREQHWQRHTTYSFL